ncbi:FHA domain-containing protein [Burkholderiales bacterium JOSHI_001]|nr:FHA domain-containing protein [Burkholderiales bacterium JOSHI_001]
MDRPEDRIALIELLERDGRVGRSVDVHRWPVTLGRALGNLVVLDDPHVAAQHASLAPDATGVLRLTVGDSANGVLVGRSRLVAGQSQALAEGSVLQLGGVRLRLRLKHDALAPERPLAAAFSGANAGRMAVLAALLLALVGAEHWVGLDPGADFTAWLPMLVSLPVALVGWCGAWALASKLFQHRFDFWGHMAILLPWLLALQLLDAVLPQVAASGGWPWLWQATRPLSAVLAALLLRAHLAHVLPGHQRAVGYAMAALVLTSGAVASALNLRSHGQLFTAPYMSTLPTPALRLGTPGTPQDLVDAMAGLREPLRDKVREAQADEAEEGDTAE